MGIDSILFSQSGDRTLQPIQTDTLVALTPDKRPVLTVMAQARKQYTKTPQYKYATWVKDTKSTDVTAIYAAGATTLVVTDSSVFTVGDEITNTTTGDVMGVEDIPTATTVTVYRLPGAVGGAIGEYVRKYSRSLPEASDAPDIYMADTAPDENRVQIFRHPYGESGTQFRTEPGPGYSEAEQRDRKWVEHIDDIEGAYFKGQGDYNATLKQWRTKGLIPTIQNGTNKWNVAGTLTLRTLRDWILDTDLSKAGSQTKVILSNGFINKAFSDWRIWAVKYFPTQVGATSELPPLQLDVAIAEIGGKRFMVINYEYMIDPIDETHFVIVDPSDIAEMVTQRPSAPAQNGDMVHRPVDRTNGYDGYDWEFFKEAGLYLKEEYRHGYAYGITGYDPDPAA